jgi:hypothetical protein
MPVATLLKSGSVGGDVLELQVRLAALGFSPGPIDGDFGPMTEQAVLNFQAANGLMVDGVVGLETRRALGLGDGEARPSLLIELGLIAEEQFGLSVGECNAPDAPARWGPVGSGHSAQSFHHIGRAFDAGGPKSSTDAFAAFVSANHASAIAELIHTPNGSIKDGVPVSPDFWGRETFDAHLHCHVAV